MHNQFNQPFERFIRKKMQALQESPSDQLWDRIAAQQREIRRWGIFRQILIRSGILAGLLAGVICGAGHWPEGFPKIGHKAAQSFSSVPQNTPSLLKSIGGQTLPNPQKKAIVTEHQSTRPSTVDLKDKLPATDQPISAHKKQNPQQNSPKQPISQGIESRVFKFISQKHLSDTSSVAAIQEQEAVGKKHWLDFPQLPVRGSVNIASVTPETSFSREKLILPIKPLREPMLQYGLSFSGGKLGQLGPAGGSHFSIGIQFQYRLSHNVHLFGGVEWQQGQRNFNPIVLGSGIQAFPQAQFPHLPQLPPVPDNLFFNLLSSWEGVSMPLGATICGKLPIRRTEWLARAYYKPYFAIKQENQLLAPLFSSLSDEVFEDKKAVLKTGWAGVQAGMSYAVDKRWQLELTLSIEQALEPVNLERINHQAFSLRLAILRR
ncbi:MAG: hypothetical protein HUU01_02840 [Saprospiraceae bacterium]|nr:hypothetical protein [Saprospiraceae bacterium]